MHIQDDTGTNERVHAHTHQMNDDGRTDGAFDTRAPGMGRADTAHFLVVLSHKSVIKCNGIEVNTAHSQQYAFGDAKLDSYSNVCCTICYSYALCMMIQ